MAAAGVVAGLGFGALVLAFYLGRRRPSRNGASWSAGQLSGTPADPGEQHHQVSPHAHDLPCLPRVASDKLDTCPAAALRRQLWRFASHIGTGNVGRIALNHLISDPRFDLTGVWVSSDAKVGKDAGELAGLDASTGITATNDLDALLATGPECAVHCAMGDNRIPEAVTDTAHLSARHQRRRNVVHVPVPVGCHARQVHRSQEEAAQQGNSSLFISGVDPDSPTT